MYNIRVLHAQPAASLAITRAHKATVFRRCFRHAGLAAAQGTRWRRGGGQAGGPWRRKKTRLSGGTKPRVRRA
eukprot:767356-Hanusia_phi.AAC.1